MGRLFGTDGIRGVANGDLDAGLAFRTGQAAARVLTGAARHKPLIVIGKDTRLSSDMLEAALVAGVTSAGADTVLIGVIPTPAVAYLTKERADAGIVISASHNPFEYNGIKIFNGDGYKLSDALEDEIEALIAADAGDTALPLKTGADIGRVRYDSKAIDLYIDYLLSCAAPDLSRLRVAVDCANGAASATAEKLFSRLGPSELRIIHDRPDGTNINDRCGSTDLESLRGFVRENMFDIGIAFDGDADRCLFVDHTGRAVDGDRVMAACALYERERGVLDAFVATVMSNLGLHVWARQNNLRVVTAPVGDRYVLEEMLNGGYVLGGEQSGHIIFARHGTTGDGQLTALKLLSVMVGRGDSLAGLVGGIPQYPQVLFNVPVKQEAKETLAAHRSVSEAVSRAAGELGAEGRVLVRPSGTEALVRVMVEGRDEDEITRLAKDIVKAIERI